MKSEIDFRYLKAFQTTAKYLNFSQAAKELGIAQSAVSRQIKLLEDSMNEQLIIRSSKKVLLTEVGKALFQATTQFESLTHEIINHDANQLIRIGILHGLLETWFIKIIKEFVKSTSHELSIEVDMPSNLKHKLISGNYDLIFTPENIQNEMITSLRLFEEKIVLISKKEVDTRSLANYPWITFGEQDFFFDLFKKHSNQIISVGSITSMIQLVKEGVGVAIVPAHTIKKDDKLVTQEIKGIKRPQIYLNTLNFKKFPKHIDELIKIIQKNS
ncbi:MAG: hypothetical protein CME62_09890 [Halobacteriovoraceae bacterium]|nr:hypothetical protein [Halobacteriovoraceae bacterium]|tara:strand:+ start:18944 stop:19759 length:816 start_codon:yes stop_codon:yes gene_type:complete